MYTAVLTLGVHSDTTASKSSVSSVVESLRQSSVSTSLGIRSDGRMNVLLIVSLTLLQKKMTHKILP